jgi:energy-coupling factor transporter ATP-binding protein EcfA2
VNQVIILEGPDGSGKTTLAKLLAHQTGGRYVHEGPPPVDGCVLQYYADKLLRYLRADRPVILDRFYLGEHVYGPVSRDKDRLGKRGVRMMRRITEAYQVMEVTCLPPWETVLKAEATNNDFLKSKQKLWEVFKRYEGLLTVGNPEVYDYTQKPEAGKLSDAPYWHDSMCIPEITYKKPRSLYLPFGAIGSRHAKLLLVGERSNTSLDLPFVSLTQSSAYLDAALQAANLPEADLAFVNAYDPAILRDRPRGNHPRTKLLQLTISRMCHPPFIVALGKEASTAIKQSGLPVHAELPHPSSHKRFNYKDRDKYGVMLHDAYVTAAEGAHQHD